MAETFASFGTGIPQNQSGALARGDYEHLLKRLPSDLLKQLDQLAKFGLFGEGGIDALMASIRKQGAFDRTRLASGLRQTVGRRLGPRSGAVDNLVANKVYAPSFAGQEESYRNINIANQQSKLGGLEGLQNLLGFFQTQVGLEEQLKQQRQGPGFLDFIGPLTDIASVLLVPETGGASIAANEARKRYV